MKPSSLIAKFRRLPRHGQWLAFGVLCIAAWLLFVHPDIMETSSHAYLLLDSIPKGRFFDFYNYVMQQPYGTQLYYINYAHYNIFVYIIFAIAQLPAWLLSLATGHINEPLLWFGGKLVSAAAFLACILVLRRIAQQLFPSQSSASGDAALMFALSPIAFFSAMVMGQYDSICLLFILLGLLCWLRGEMWGFVLWMGMGAACKFFSLLVFLPLLLLRTKRPLQIIKYGAASLWLLAPTTLLFWGRTGDMGFFNQLMLQRLFSSSLPAGRQFAAFPAIFLLLCVVSFFWHPKKESEGSAAVWLCLAVFGSLFLLTDWHPQWLILLTPFLVLTSLQQQNKLGWFFVDILQTTGFFLLCATAFSRQLEANLLDNALPGLISGLSTARLEAFNTISFYLDLLPAISQLGMVLFGGALLCHILLKAPLTGGTPATRLAPGQATLPQMRISTYAWGIFVAGALVWLVPTLFTWCKAFGFI